VSRRRLEPEPEERIARREASLVRRASRYISSEKIMILMDGEQPLRLRLAIGLSMLPVLLATLGEHVETMDSQIVEEPRSTGTANIVNLAAVMEGTKKYLEAYSTEALKTLEETCKKHHKKACRDLQAFEAIHLPIEMLKDGVPIDIVVETMAILYSTLAYALRLVAPEQFMASLISQGTYGGIG
jgi:nitrogenase molybdenum-iron protein alpha/beta subunit